MVANMITKKSDPKPRTVIGGTKAKVSALSGTIIPAMVSDIHSSVDVSTDIIRNQLNKWFIR